MQEENKNDVPMVDIDTSGEDTEVILENPKTRSCIFDSNMTCRTTGGPTVAPICKFPFEYEGKTFYDCKWSETKPKRQLRKIFVEKI